MRQKHFERGSSMVEFAFAAMALFLVLFGIIEFGRMLYTYHTVSNAARLGARWAMVRGTASCSGAVGKQLSACPANQNEVQSFVQSQVTLLGPGTLTVTATWPGGNAGCNSADSHAAPCVVVVTASHDFTFLIPFVGTKLTIASTSKMDIAQ